METGNPGHSGDGTAGRRTTYTQKDRIAPEVADMSRRLIGDERTARVEGWFFKVEDRVDKAKYRLFGGETNPFATQQVRIVFVPKPATRELFYFVGEGSDDCRRRTPSSPCRCSPR